jgi:hypothetical protein
VLQHLDCLTSKEQISDLELRFTDFRFLQFRITDFDSLASALRAQNSGFRDAQATATISKGIEDGPRILDFGSPRTGSKIFEMAQEDLGNVTGSETIEMLENLWELIRTKLDNTCDEVMNSIRESLIKAGLGYGTAKAPGMKRPIDLKTTNCSLPHDL